MQVAAFVFVQRKWENDKSHFEKMLDYFCDIREPLQLLIFPEGTDLTGRCICHLLGECSTWKFFVIYGKSLRKSKAGAKLVSYE